MLLLFKDLNIIKNKDRVVDGKCCDKAFKKGEVEFDKLIKIHLLLELIQYEIKNN